MFWNGYILIIQGFPSIPKILLFLIPRLLHYDPKLLLKMSLLNWHSLLFEKFWILRRAPLLYPRQPLPRPNFLRSSPTREAPGRIFTLKYSGNNFVLSISFCDGKKQKCMRTPISWFINIFMLFFNQVWWHIWRVLGPNNL